MGGNALAFPTRRLSWAEYTALKAKMVRILQCQYEVAEGTVPLPDKEDHGDVDVLVAGPVQDFDPLTHPDIRSKEKVLNGPVLSFECDGFQVDAILIELRSIDFARLFSSYSDIGFILGFICKPVGLVFSEKGLSVVLPSQMQTPGSRLRLEMTVDPDRALEFLGLSYSRWKQGFQTQLEVFEFLSGCRFLRRDVFRPEEKGTKRMSVRSQGRPVLQGFVDHVIRLDADGKDAGYSTQQVMDEALAFFGKTEEYREQAEAADRQRRVKQKLNAKHLTAWTGLSGKELGEAMQKVKASVSQKAILELTLEELEIRVKQLGF